MDGDDLADMCRLAEVILPTGYQPISAFGYKARLSLLFESKAKNSCESQENCLRQEIACGWRLLAGGGSKTPPAPPAPPR